MAETKKKRERIEDGEGRDLKRVAEIVMVLEAMGQMRGGKDPSDFERGLSVEARDKLVEICASSAKPNDLFSSDSARIVAADLGFSSVKDRMGNRPIKKASIVEKLAITKKKLQEMKESTPQQVQQPSSFQPVGMLSKLENRGASIQDSNRPPSFHTNTLTSSSVRPTHFIETPLRQPSVPLEKDSSISTPVHAQMGGHFRMDTRPSGQLFGSHAQGNRNTDKISSIPPASSLSTVVSKPSPITKLIDHAPKKFDSTRAVNSFQSPQMFKDQGSRNFAIHPIQGSTGSVQQHPNGFNSLQTSLPNNHGDISRVLQGFLPRIAIDSSSWNPPSVEYMNKLINCQVCKISITDTESLLICDACEKGVHLRCLKTFNQKSVSYIEWHCPHCLLSSNGKSWAPKYGKVTRNVAVSKGSSNAGAYGIRVPSEKENLASKVDNQKIASNMSSSSSNCTHSHVADGHLSIPNKKEFNPGEMLSKESSLSNLQAADAPCTQTNTVNLKENDISVCTDHAMPCKNSSQCEVNDGLVSCTVNISPSGSSEPKVVSAHPVELHTDVSDVFHESENQILAQNDDGLDEWINELSGNSLKEIGKCADEEINQYSGFREISNSKTLFVPDNVSIYENSHQEIINVKNPHLEIGRCINEGIKEQSKFREISNPDMCNKGGQERISNSHAATKVDILCETKVHKELKLEHLHGVKWIGDALDNVDKKTYYQSCCINDLVYNLQDDVLIRSKKHGISPSKLQVLWEDSHDGSKWAAVNQFYFPKDLPEGIIQPSSPENEEVYESNDSITIDASCIRGPCLVLPWLTFKEERERRSRITEGDNSMRPIFLCRWSYDKSKSSFQPRVC